MKHPSAKAKELADAILSDTIAAGQIKEWLNNDQLIDVLAIKLPPLPEQPEPDIDDFSDREIVREIHHRDIVDEVIEEADFADLLAELKSRGVTIEAIQDFYSK